MKNTRYFSWSAAVIIVLAASWMPLAAQSDNQPLGDYARTMRKTKGGSSRNASPKVYDNDNLPDGTVSVVGNPEPEARSIPKTEEQDQAKDTATNTGDKTADKTGEKSEEKTPHKADGKSVEPQIQPGQTAEERQKALQGWKEKIDEQKEKIAAVSHELDLLQREYRLKAAEFYSNTANRVQHPYGFADDDAKYKQQIADKQKELEDAQTKLDEMQETGRKAGAPNSVNE